MFQLHLTKYPIDIKLYCSSDSTLWILSNQGAFKVLKIKEEPSLWKLELKNILPEESILTMYEDTYGSIWFGTYESGAFVLEPRTQKLIQFDVGNKDGKHLSHSIVRTFNEDPYGNLWIGTGGGGINIYNYKTGIISYQDPELGNKYAISSNIIYCIYADPDQNFWIGTYNGGVSFTSWYRQSFNHVRSFGAAGELNNNAVLSFCELPDGKMWIGTDGGGVNVFDPKTNVHTPLRLPGVDHAKVITSLRSDTKGNIYIGTYRDGLIIHNIYSGKTTYINTVTNKEMRVNDVWDIAVGKDESIIWLATLGAGLIKYNLKTRKISSYMHSNKPGAIAEDYLSCLWIDSRNNLWLGTYHGGLSMLPESKGDKFVTYRKDTVTALSSNEIRVIFEDSRGRILVGTQDGGLNILDNQKERFSVYRKHHGLPGNTVQGILESNDGYIWLSTNNGLSRVIWSEENQISFRNYNALDGLQANEFNIHATYKNTKGVLYFGGINGYNAFNPSEIVENKGIGEVVLTNVFVFDEKLVVGGANSPIDKNIRLTNSITLKPWQTTLTFEFAMLDYIVPGLNRYEYRLVGFENEWINSGTRRRATYTNIDPGEYTFEVKGVNSQGITSKSNVALNINIKPPFYQTPMFRLMLVSTIVLLLIAVYRARVKVLHNQGIMLKSMVDERTKELRSLNEVLELRNQEINAQSDTLRDQQKTLLVTNTKLEKSYKKIEHQKIELEDHRNNLEEIVKERTIELEEAKQRAEESEQLKMAFLSNMSHEIRTPMNAIVGFASLLADEELSIQEKAEYIRQVNMNSESLLILIDDILDLSKIEANQLLVNKSTFEVNSFLNEVFFNWQLLRQKDDSPIKLKYSNDQKDKQIYIYSDELRLRQIINNLLDNAFKFTSEGVIELALKLKDNLLEFSVSDSGIGISDEDKSRIFNRFRKGEESGRKLYRGAGLGLTISNKLAELLGGKLSVESEQGSGSTFFFTVPVTQVSEAKKPVKVQEPLLSDQTVDFSGLKILIAEDEETNYKYLDGILRKKKVKVDWAKNGKEAIKLVSINSYDLVLMDIKMPEIDGLEATKKIKQMFPDQHIIAQTAFARPEEEAEFRKVGFTDYISKPIKRKVLVNLIAKYLPE